MTARRAVPGRVQRAERMVGDLDGGVDLFRRLTLRSATGTAQRAIPTNFGFRIQQARLAGAVQKNKRRLKNCREGRGAFTRIVSSRLWL